MDERLSYMGLFQAYTHQLGPSTLKNALSLIKQGWQPEEVGLKTVKLTTNTLMADFKRQMAALVFPKIDRLVITNQTSTPQDNEAVYSGVIYSAGPDEELSRSVGEVNPFSVAWNITSNDANGNWGSFILIDGGGNMINRALAGITKTANQNIVVEFTGSVT